MAAPLTPPHLQVTFEAVGENGGNKVSYEATQESIADEDEQDEECGIKITCTEKTKLSFSIKYLGQFAKATTLSTRTRISMSAKLPIVVEFSIEDDGYLKFYLAPKIEEDVDDD